MKKTIDIPKHFTIEEAARFRENTYSILSKNTIEFELNFSSCEFIDSTGLGVLVGLLKKCGDNGSTIVIKSLKKEIREMFHMTRLDQVFEIIE